MIRSLYTAATGMTSQQMEQDVVANNLANVNTVGFKKSRPNFQDLMYQVYSKAGATSALGIQLPNGLEVGMGSRAISSSKIFTQGDFQQTGNNFDWAIEGDGFFMVDDGSGTIGYTRAGSFKLNSNGDVCNPDGYLIQPPLNIPQGTVVVTVDKSGTVVVTDSVGTMTELGQLEIANFINPSGLTSGGRNLYYETAASGVPEIGAPNTEGRGAISQHTLEGSNVNMIEEMVKMITGQRAYEINSKAITTADEMLSIVNNLKR
ncbi:MAG: flagellar basal-body rod protein FlgG [Syntrophaceae bacterium]|nr:flagellar basal-body rod protein FlgG [Syntrophaceae bacterium]